MSNPLVNQPCPSCGRYELAYGFDVVEGPRAIRQVRFRQCGACDWCGPLTTLHIWPTPMGEYAWLGACSRGPPPEPPTRTVGALQSVLAGRVGDTPSDQGFLRIVGA